VHPLFDMDDMTAPRILVVDDTDEVRQVFAHFLRRSGMHVVQADNGRTGFASARDVVPDVVVCDINMPEMDGLELCRQLRNDAATRATPILMVSGDASSQSQAALDAGCDAVLGKPCSEALLVTTVRRLLTRPSGVGHSHRI
jgi:two-component system cell cycle response regulator DivK